MIDHLTGDFLAPLNTDEVIGIMRYRWGVTYEIRLVSKGKRLYLQVMWGYLEQQSVSIKEKDFLGNLNKILEIVNRSGNASFVRRWLLSCQGKPRLGRALSLPLEGGQRLKEFLL